MTPDLYKRAKEIFFEVCELDGSRRSELLDRRCGDNIELRRAVDRMLAHDNDPLRIEAGAPMRERLDGLLQQAATSSIGPSKADQPERIGNYRILELVGEGGFGTVFKAEQLQPVRRTVAVKLIKPGMATKQAVARFNAERQALAIMDHPCIARVFDAGETEFGQPYLVMEWIQGQPITRFCDQTKLSLHDRLRLFMKVCHAVQFAHQKGIIHRDIKPSNIIVVDGGPASPSTPKESEHGPIPKVIDFGIAKVIDEVIRGQTIFTEQGQMIGTPEYMSPEQAAGDRDIDTRSDVYSLGVLLYELLTGTTPLNRSTITEKGMAAYVKFQQVVCEVDPPTPSSRLKMLGDGAHAVAGDRRMDPLTLRRLMRGDLDWIVMKALEKNRERRYGSANSLSADIQRHLSDEPVNARPPTISYRFAKFARRKKVALTAGSAVALALIAGAVTAGIGWTKSVRSEKRALAEASIARAVNDFLNDDLLAAVSPDQLGNDVQMRKVVEVAADHLEGKFADQPEVEAAIRLTLGRTFRKLGDLQRAEQHLVRSREIRARILGLSHPTTLGISHELGHVHIQDDRSAEAESLFRQAYEGRKRLWGPQHPDSISSLYELSVAIGEQGRYAETEQLMLEALDLARHHLGNTHSLTITIVRGVGVLYSTIDQPDKAGPYYEEGHELAKSSLGPEHPTTLLLLTNLAHLRIEEQRFYEAEKMLANALMVSKRVRGEQHPATIVIMTNLAFANFGLNRRQDAEKIYLEALDLAEKSLPGGHSVIFTVQRSLARMYDKLREFDKAERLWMAIIAYTDKYGASHPEMLRAAEGFVAHYEAAGDANRASEYRERLHAAKNAETDHSRQLDH